MRPKSRRYFGFQQLLGWMSCATLLATAGIAQDSGTSGALQPESVLGSLSSVGTVSLRGVPLAGEGTLFAGDQIRTSDDAWVAVSLAGGSQLELGEDTEVQVGTAPAGTLVAMSRGRIAVASGGAGGPMTVSVGSFDIVAPAGSAAEIAFLEPRSLSVTALREAVAVRWQDGQDTEDVPEGEQRIINLDAEVQPSQPDPPQDGESSSRKTWILVGAGVGGGTGVAILLSGDDSASPSQP